MNVVTLFLLLQILLVVNCEECNKFWKKVNVTVNIDETFLEKSIKTREEGVCMEACSRDPKCTGFLTTEVRGAVFCVPLPYVTIAYRSPGPFRFYYKVTTQVTCQHGWTGSHCDVCARNFGPVGDCTQCLRGWTGFNCDHQFRPPSDEILSERLP